MSRPVLLAPHNDDETLFASFLCLRHKPLVIVCLRSFVQEARGDGITYGQREEETAAAMDILGCDWQQWTVPDDAANWQTQVAARLRDHGDADHVFAPAFEVGGHDHHNDLAVMVGRMFPQNRQTSYLTYTKAGKSDWGTMVPYELDWVRLKMKALSCYESQMSHPLQVEHFLRPWFEYTA